MYDVLRIHITITIRAISLWTIDFFFELRFFFDINWNLVKRFGEQWSGHNSISKVSVIHLLFDDSCCLPHSVIVDDEGVVVEDATFCHDFFYRATRFRNDAWLNIGIDCR